MKFKEFVAADWDARCRRLRGYGPVMNTAYPQMEMVAETHRQKEYIVTLPLPLNRFEMEYDVEGIPIGPKQLSESDATLLDVGCGVGRLLHILNDFVVRADGLDWSRVMLEAANKNFPEMILVNGDARDPGIFSRGQYDIAFQWNVLSHITDPGDWERAVKNMKQWAKRYVVHADYLDIGPESPSTRLYGTKELKSLMRGWKILWEDTYTLKIGNADFQTMEVLVFASTVEIKRLKEQEAPEEVEVNALPAEVMHEEALVG